MLTRPSRRALLAASDLRRMARVAREEGVSFRGRVDALGGLTFTISPILAHVVESEDDLDTRIEAYGSR